MLYLARREPYPLQHTSSEKGLKIGTGINRKLHSFKFEIDQIFLEHQNIIELAKINTFFDNSIEFKHREDIVSISVNGNSIVVNYNMNPYETSNVKRPNFISAVLRYIDGLDVNRYLDFNDSAEFQFVVTNFTNSLRRIFVEFKHSDNHSLLDTFEFAVSQGENKFSLSLERMRSKALSNISEICFVIHPDDVVEDEGMFKISEIEIT